MWRGLLLIVLGLGLAGCDPFARPERLLDEYLTRLARVLDVSVQTSSPEVAPRLPRPRERQLAIAAVDVSMLDFLAYYGCDLQQVIGERTAILGRVMQPLNLLRYELRFIDAAERCLLEISNVQRRQRLQQVIAHKRDNLSRVIWNSSWALPELETLLSPSRGLYPVNIGPAPVQQQAEQLQYKRQRLQALLDGDLQQDLTMLSDIHQQWQYLHYGGQLLNSAQLLIVRLDDGSAMLQQRLGDKPLCYDGKPNNRARQMQGMFMRVYIGEVQPYLSDVSRAAKALFSELEQLAAIQQAVMPASFKVYYQTALQQQSPHSVWQALQQSIDRHTEHWQALLQQCGMRPSAEPDAVALLRD